MKYLQIFREKCIINIFFLNNNESVKTAFICFHNFVWKIYNINNKRDSGCLSMVQSSLEVKL